MAVVHCAVTDGIKIDWNEWNFVNTGGPEFTVHTDELGRSTSTTQTHHNHLIKESSQFLC